jgi:hypothetical protein
MLCQKLCLQCVKSLTNREQLKWHTRVHAGENPVVAPCDTSLLQGAANLLCIWEFMQAINSMVTTCVTSCLHRTTNLKCIWEFLHVEKPYDGTVCGKSFAQYFQLTVFCIWEFIQVKNPMIAPCVASRLHRAANLICIWEFIQVKNSMNASCILSLFHGSTTLISIWAFILVKTPMVAPYVASLLHCDNLISIWEFIHVKNLKIGPCVTSLLTLMKQLNKHMRVHAGEKTHNCTLCGKFSALRKQLNQHIRVHTGKKPMIAPCVVSLFPQSRASNLNRIW